MAILIRPDGNNDEVVPADGRKWTLAELQGYVDGYIEPVRLPPRTSINGNPVTRMYVNEEGLLRQLQHNQTASDVADQTIVGTAVVFLKGDKLT